VSEYVIGFITPSTRRRDIPWLYIPAGSIIAMISPFPSYFFSLSLSFPAREKSDEQLSELVKTQSSLSLLLAYFPHTHTDTYIDEPSQ
jgi:hypothetical protein